MIKVPARKDRNYYTAAEADLLTHEIEHLQDLREDQLQYDQRIKNQKLVQLIAIFMLAFAFLCALSAAIQSQPTHLLAILLAAGGGYLVKIKNADERA